MAICAECGSIVPDTAKLCPNCGMRVEPAQTHSPITVNQDGKRVVVPPSRAQRQRRPVTPFDEKRPFSYAQPPPREEDQAATSRRMTHQEDVLFDEDQWDDKQQTRRNRREISRDGEQSAALPREQTRFSGERSQKHTGRQAVIGAGDYLLSMILMLIPVIGLALGLLWARGASNPSKRNFGKAAAILNGAATVIGVIVFVLIRWVF